MKKVFGLVCAFLLFFVGCGTVSFVVPITKPAEVNLKKFKTIAIGQIDGEGAEDFADELTQSIFNCGRFEVLDRQNLNRIMEEHKFSLSGVVNEATAAQLGKFLGAAALVFGRVSEYKYKENKVYSDYQDSKTGIVTRYYQRIGQVDITANLRVTDLTTGKILAVKNIPHAIIVKSAKSEGEPAGIDKDALFAQARQAVVDSFMKMIAPYQVNARTKFFIDGKMPELARGAQLAKAGQMEEAIEIFKETIKKYAGTPELKIDKAHYDLGEALILVNKYPEAIKEYKDAVKINPKQKWYQTSVSGAIQQEKEYKKLLEQQ